MHYLAWAERPIYRALGTSPEQEQNWKRYAGSLVIFSPIAMAITYLIIRTQGSLPLNPQHLGAVSPALCFNTAGSFLTNTNWQNYGGETTMSYFSQIGALTFEQFREPCHRGGRGYRAGTRVLPAQLAHHRELLGRHDPRHPLHLSNRSPSSSASSLSAKERYRPWPGAGQLPRLP